MDRGAEVPGRATGRTRRSCSAVLRATAGPPSAATPTRRVARLCDSCDAVRSPVRPGSYDFARDMFFQGTGAPGFVMGAITNVLHNTSDFFMVRKLS